MDNQRSQWGSNIGFLLAAIGSAVGLGNIWGFPYKMGKCGGFSFLLVYLVLAIFVGMVIMVSELALGRKTQQGAIGTYSQVCKEYKVLGWLAVIAPFLIMSFYSVLGGYCLQYLSLNLAEASFNLQEAFEIQLTGSNTFGAMLTNPFGCIVFTLLFMIICYFINKSDVSEGIEKFNKIGMPALFGMLCIVIIRALTMDGASEGLKFMFKPGYAVEAGFIESAPSLISVIGTAGGQMFFSLSLAMGIMITYGSYLSKEENLKRNSTVIVIADTVVALMAGIAVIPAAVANGIQNGIPYAEIKLSGPNLLFVTLQNVFAEMGEVGPVFGAIFYLLVLVAAISSAISLIEVISTHFIDAAKEKGKTANRKNIVTVICIAIMIAAALVAADGLGSNGFSPWQVFGISEDHILAWNDCWLDFMDCWSEGIAMPFGAMVMALMIGFVLKPDYILKELEIGGGKNDKFGPFYKVCITVIAPLVMCFVFAGQLSDFFGSQKLGYIISVACLVIFLIYSLVVGKKDAYKK